MERILEYLILMVLVVAGIIVVCIAFGNAHNDFPRPPIPRDQKTSKHKDWGIR